MSNLPARAERRCHNAVNPLHSSLFFSPDLGAEMAKIGIEDQSAAYFATRAAALGAVGAGTVSATFYNFNPALVARHVPAVWETASPDVVLGARLRAADTTLRRLLGEEVIASDAMAEAARLALRATEACTPHARPLYAAHADLPVPEEPHLAFWHAATCCASTGATRISPSCSRPAWTRWSRSSATRPPARAWRSAGSCPHAAGAAPTGRRRPAGCGSADWCPTARSWR